MGTAAHRFGAGLAELARATPNYFRTRIVIGIGIVNRGIESLLIQCSSPAFKGSIPTATNTANNQQDAWQKEYAIFHAVHSEGKVSNEMATEIVAGFPQREVFVALANYVRMDESFHSDGLRTIRRQSECHQPSFQVLSHKIDRLRG